MTKLRRIDVLIVVASLTLLIAACGGSEEGANKTTTSDKTESTVASSSDGDFTTKVNKIAASIKAAETDVCKVATAQNIEPPEPTNPTQVAAVIKVYAQLLRSMARAISEAAAGPAASLQRAADEVEKAAKDAKYSSDFLSSNGLVSVLSNAGVSEGIDAFAKATKECPGSADMSGSEAIPKG